MGELRPDQLDRDPIARCECGDAIPCKCLDVLENPTDDERAELLAAIDAGIPEE